MEILLTVAFFGIIWGLMALSPRFRSDPDNCDKPDSGDQPASAGGACSSCGLKGSCSSSVDDSKRPLSL